MNNDARSRSTKELAILLAGNVKGIGRVEADDLLPTAVMTPSPQSPAPQASVEYCEINSGDTLLAIAKRYYGKASAYMAIFEANREVIKEPNKIYPGQKIRIPLAYAAFRWRRSTGSARQPAAKQR